MSDLLDAFNRCWPVLQSALGSPATHTKAQLWALIESGRQTFFPIGEYSAMVGNVLTAPTGLRTGNLWLAGGELDEIKGAIPGMVELSRRLDCDLVSIYCRPGFQRVLKPHGFEFRRVHLVKDLRNVCDGDGQAQAQTGQA